MKKSIIIFCMALIATALMAFSYLNRSNTPTNHKETFRCNADIFNDVFALNIPEPAEIDLVYNVDSRFGATITKENLCRATSAVDIVPKEAEWSKISFLSMTIAVLQDGDEIRVSGDDEVLNPAQTTLLQSIDYSTNFYLKARGKTKNGGPDGMQEFDQEEYALAYYITVVPEKEAAYTAGKDALISYLRENSKAATAIIRKDQLQPGRVLFTVTKEGTIADVTLESTSGYPSVDQTLVELLATLPGKWEPATNAKGENVDQELVFFFGLQGC